MSRHKKVKIKKIYISWAPHCSRSDNTIRELDGESVKIYYLFFGSNYFSVLFKYLFQTINTFLVLLEKRPDVIFIMNPPIFTCIPIWLYCKVFRKRGYITDSHTAAFSMKKWQLLFPLQKFFFRRAITNIVTNLTHSKLIEKMGANVTVVGDVPIKFKVFKPYKKMKTGFNITFVNIFSHTEPVDVVIETARQLGDINFYITGSLKNADKKFLNDCSANVIFTDFICDEEYGWLLQNSDIVMTLVNIDNTMQRGAYEAMSVETPVITTDWSILRKTFYKGTVFVTNDVDSIIQGIVHMKGNYRRYNKEIEELKKERYLIWLEKKQEINDKIFNAK